MSRLVTVRFCMYERRTPAVSIHRDQTSCDEYWSSETAGSALMERRVVFTAVSEAACRIGWCLAEASDTQP